MTPNQLMIERAKEFILDNCLDTLCVTTSRIFRYLRSDNCKKSYDYIYSVHGSTINIERAMRSALIELVHEGKAVKIGSKYRAKLKLEKQQEAKQ